MEPILLQPWTTQRIAYTPFSTVTQDVEDYVDVEPYQDATFWIDVREVSSPAPGGNPPTIVQLSFETAPDVDDSLFQQVGPAVSLAAGSAFTQTLRTALNAPLAKWLRWRLTLANPQSGTWDVCFRVWAMLSKTAFFTPLQLSGCVLWLRGDLGLTFNYSNTPATVSGWADQSGNGNNASQGTSANQPSFDATIMNGWPAIKNAAGGAAYMTTGSFSFGTAITMFAAVQPLATPQVVNRILETNFATDYYLGTDNGGTKYKLIVANPTNPEGIAEGGTITVGANTLVCGTFSPAGASGTGSLYVNGSFVASDTFTTPSANSFPLQIMRSASGGNNWQGYLGEAILYNRALSTNELTRVHRYLGGRYGVSVP